MTPLKATLLMHLVALLWGASGVLGSIITVPSTIVTAGRSICSVITLLLVFRVTAFRELTKLSFNAAFKVVLKGEFEVVFEVVHSAGVAGTWVPTGVPEFLFFSPTLCLLSTTDSIK